MSNYLAIATVTMTLRQIVRDAISLIGLNANPDEVVVTGRPKATDGAGSDPTHVYLYLYQVSPNAALRNNDLPTRSAEGKLVQRPKAALDLHYLLAFRGNESELEPQRMLGAVVRDLHTRPLLRRQEIKDAIDSSIFLGKSNLDTAIEQIKFTPTLLSLEELSKIWYVFLQTPHALSVAYQASVVLIDAEESGAVALPVLQRGREDRGVTAATFGAYPYLERIHIGEPKYADRIPRLRSYPSAQLGTQLTLIGRDMIGDTVEVRFRHQRKTVIPPLGKTTANEITIDIPILQGQGGLEWIIGLYSVDIFIKNDEGLSPRTTDSVPLALAPRLVGANLQGTIEEIIVNGQLKTVATITINCTPPVLQEQSVELILAYSEISPTTRSDAPSEQFTFHAPPQVSVDVPQDERPNTNGQIAQTLRTKFKNEGLLLGAGATITIVEDGARWLIQDGDKAYHALMKATEPKVYIFPSSTMLRLRVDGVNSMPFLYQENPNNPTAPPQLAFDDTQRVTIS